MELVFPADLASGKRREALTRAPKQPVNSNEQPGAHLAPSTAPVGKGQGEREDAGGNVGYWVGGEDQDTPGIPGMFQSQLLGSPSMMLLRSKDGRAASGAQGLGLGETPVGCDSIHTVLCTICGHCVSGEGKSTEQPLPAS